MSEELLRGLLRRGRPGEAQNDRRVLLRADGDHRLLQVCRPPLRRHLQLEAHLGVIVGIRDEVPVARVLTEDGPVQRLEELVAADFARRIGAELLRDLFAHPRCPAARVGVRRQPFG